MNSSQLRPGLDCPACGDIAFLKDQEGVLCDETGKPVFDGDKAICGCNVHLSADEDGAEVAGEW